MKAGCLTRREVLSLVAAPLLAQRASPFSAAEAVFLEDLSRRAFLYFWERASTKTGLVLDRALNSDKPDARKVSSSAATGFGLTALCIAAERGWKSRAELRERTLSIVRFYAIYSHIDWH